MSLKAAFDRLGQLSVSGVTNVGLDDLAGMVNYPDLPALVVLPAATGGEGLQVSAFDDGAADLVVHVDHALLVTGLGQGLVNVRFYQGLALIDLYLTALKADIRLNDTLVRPIRIVGISFGPQTLGGVAYYAVTFRHRWELDVS
jgi:hypothetical protein